MWHGSWGALLELRICWTPLPVCPFLSWLHHPHSHWCKRPTVADGHVLRGSMDPWYTLELCHARMIGDELRRDHAQFKNEAEAPVLLYWTYYNHLQGYESYIASSPKLHSRLCSHAEMQSYLKLWLCKLQSTLGFQQILRSPEAMEGGCITSFAVWKQCDMPVVCDKPTMALRIHNKLPDKVTQRGDGFACARGTEGSCIPCLKESWEAYWKSAVRI